VNDLGAQILRRTELCNDARLTGSGLQEAELFGSVALFLRVCVRSLIFIDEEDEQRNSAGSSPIKLELGHGNAVPIGNMAVASSKDADVDVSPIHHFE